MRCNLNGRDWRVLGLTPSEWAWRRVGDAGTDLDNLQPATPAWIASEVPGDIQSDLLETGELPDPTVDMNSRAWEWTSQRDWVYHKDFVAPERPAHPLACLRFESVDHRCHVFLNGKELGEHVGAYTPFEHDVTNILKYGATNRLVVVVEHAPNEPCVQGQIGWTSRIREWKPRFAYGWDWCTRLVPLGITGDVTLTVTNLARVSSVRTNVVTPADAGPAPTRAIVCIRSFVEASRSARATLQAVITAPSGDEVARASQLVHLAAGTTSVEFTIILENPCLWWPNDLGDHPVYHVAVTLSDDAGAAIDTTETVFGVRRLRFLPNDDATKDAIPYVIEVNGVRMFVKGWNWAPIDQLYGREHRDEYTHAVRLAANAHCNLLRVWGGGLLEREHFYSVCDAVGILIWQEFFQSSSGVSNVPATDPDYVEYARNQARQIAPLRANHPSLAVWCGGNELVGDDWHPIDESHPVIGAIAQVVRDETPECWFMPTSPSGPVFAASLDNIGKMHDVHGNWQFMGDPAHYDFFNRIDPLFHSEFGVEGPANPESLQRFVSERFLWPPDRTNPAWVHHGAWWLNRATVEALFGNIDDIDTFVQAGQWLQAEGLRYAVEASRIRQWHTSGAIPWQLNEAWPNTSCTNAIDYYGRPRPAYWTVANAFAPVLVSVRHDGIAREPGSDLDVEVFISGARMTAPATSVHWRFTDCETDSTLAEGQAPIPGDAVWPGSASVCQARTSLPNTGALVVLHVAALDAAGATVAQNVYVFSTFPAPALQPMRATKRASLKVGMPDRRTLEITASSPVFGLRVAPVDDRGVYVSIGYALYAAPGAVTTAKTEGGGRIRVSAWNAAPIEVSVG